ncbi:MAG: PEP-CTERM sorting domain-containing protein [Betaproteobacteria bacterium]|nr:PEP-CTERM sorting domain-containing protein [Betaproteobacteria bacterium]
MNRFIRCRHLLFAVATLASAGTVHAVDPSISVDMNLGPDRIIDASSVAWRVSRTVSNSAGSVVGRQVSAPSLSDVMWTQNVDATVPLLWKAMAGGNGTAQDARVDFALPGAGDPTLALVLHRPQVTGLDVSNDVVSASAAYNKFSMTYDYVEHGKSGPIPFRVVYDLSSGYVPNPVKTRAARAFEGQTPAASNDGSTSIYMRLGTAENVIAGDSRAKGYENWIALDSAHMGGSVSVTSATSGGGGQASQPAISEFEWTQPFDGSVPLVLGNLFGGNIGMSATIDFVKDEGAGPVTYMQFVLDDGVNGNGVIFSDLSLSASGSDSPTVTGSMAFSRFSQTVWSFNEDGTRGDSTVFAYDLNTQTSIDRLDSGSANNFGAGNLAGHVPVAAGAVSAPVPEPETWAMMVGGLGLLGGATRIRRVSQRSRAA